MVIGKMKKLLLGILLCFLLNNTFMEPVMGLARSPGGGYCAKKCDVRCARADVIDRCIKYCNICCTECKCFPSGTYGNKHQCPCYRDKRNSKGKPKCP